MFNKSTINFSNMSFSTSVIKFLNMSFSTSSIIFSKMGFSYDTQYGWSGDNMTADYFGGAMPFGDVEFGGIRHFYNQPTP